MRFAPFVVCLVVLAGCTAGLPASDPGPTAGEATAGSEPGGSATATPRTATATPHPATAPTVRVRVVAVVDGDTMRIRFGNGTRDTVRLLGVDTPEVEAENTPDEFEGVPSTAAGRACLREYGERASAFATRRLEGATVGLGFDPNEPRRGYYDRLLAYVYVDGTQFNHRLLVRGHARRYESGLVERERYARAESRARTAGRGLWTCADGASTAPPTALADGGGTPATTTAVDGPLAVSVHADAPGNDHEDPNGEYVALRNRGDRTLDLAGWTVRDAAGHAYAFPDGATLAPDATIRLHTGTGTDGDGRYYWGRSRAVWNNGGDTVTVTDDAGRTVVSRRY
ncbi:MAG: lamin tail domain-containing protein [Haloferacaceae archaeon]